MRWPDRRGRFWPTVATVAGVAVTVGLGNWQLTRGAEKRALKIRFEAQAAQPPVYVGARELNAADVELRRVEAQGVFDSRYAVYLDNRIHRGVPGYHVIMPLRVEGGERYVLVNRGWVPRTAFREVPQVRTPAGRIAVTGIATIPGRAFELSDAVIEGPIWQNLTLERYRKAMPLEIQPFVLRQDSALDDGLVRAWPAPDFGVDKHYGYAFQWFALAATLIAFYAYTQVKRRRSRAT